ncbi:unnamed protein product [Ceutorhynchus assimilis]|uniref:THAP-type domain-containing protein n=1 Tax=Ceutorhynchus assimilis TaxID=467358 RepID=A0A9N9QPM4_9CUCU|nr:unnamed protein product [Ceutorhynchus assimilis]
MTQKQLYWFNKRCSVPDCSNSSTEGPGVNKEYFDLPAEPQARKRWLNAILIEDGDDLKICEDHFQETDVFRDKNNRKKLIINSVPSLLSKPNICTRCHGLKNPSSVSSMSKTCQCENSVLTPKQPPSEKSSDAVQSPEHPVFSNTAKKPRLKWTTHEKNILFKVIKSYGEVKVGAKIHINWRNVAIYCRAKGCFGNQNELRNVWQSMRINAVKVYRNEIFGSKLDRKVSRFLFGKAPRKNRRKITNNNNNNENDGVSKEIIDTSTTEGDEQRKRQAMIESAEKEELETIPTDSTTESGIVVEDIEEYDAEEEDSDEYFTLSDVEDFYHIQIRPRINNNEI